MENMVELASPYASFDCFYTSRRRNLQLEWLTHKKTPSQSYGTEDPSKYQLLFYKKYVSRRTSRSSGEGAPRVEAWWRLNLRMRLFAVLLRLLWNQKPFDGLRTVYSPPSLFTLLLKANIFFSLEFARLSSRGTTNLLTFARNKTVQL